MYPHFIEVHDIRKPEDAMLINIKAIKHIYFEPETNSGAISLVDKVFVPTKESYDELKKLITDSGCLIQMGDPRLDNKPLTIDNFKDLVGQPVYSINDNRWYIVHWFDIEEHNYKCAYLYSDEGVQVWWDAEKLIAKPLYRMKVSNGLVQ